MATVTRYGMYSRAIDRLERKMPELAQAILAGNQKLTQNQVIALSTMKPSQIKKATARTGQVADSKAHKNNPAIPSPSVKDMPKHDPDGEVIALTLTVPSWKESIERVTSVADLRNVSFTARNKAQAALSDLITSAENLITSIQSIENC